MATRSGRTCLLAKNITCDKQLQICLHINYRNLQLSMMPILEARNSFWVEVVGCVSNGGYWEFVQFVLNSLEEHLRILGAVISQGFCLYIVHQKYVSKISLLDICNRQEQD